MIQTRWGDKDLVCWVSAWFGRRTPCWLGIGLSGWNLMFCDIIDHIDTTVDIVDLIDTIDSIDIIVLLIPLTLLF